SGGASIYGAPRRAAAKAVAKSHGAKVTVFDAANDPKKQLAELQTAASSKQYQAIIVQPIFGPQLTSAVQSAIKSGIKVVNMDQNLGTNTGSVAPPIKGLSGTVIFVQNDIAERQGAPVVPAL